MIYLVISRIYLMIFRLPLPDSRLPTGSACRLPTPDDRLPTRFDREFGTNQWANPGGEGGFVEARGAVDAVQVEQRQRRVAKRRGSLGERFGKRCPTEE